MGQGGFAPAYNVQIATDTHRRAIVGIDVTRHGTDHDKDRPLRDQVERRSGQKVSEHLPDGGYVKAELIDKAAEDAAVQRIQSPDV